jgi:hypothetical protein
LIPEYKKPRTVRTIRGFLLHALRFPSTSAPSLPMTSRRLRGPRRATTHSRARHRRLSTSRPWSQSNHPGRRSRNGSLTKSLISTDSTVPGIPPIPIPTASTKAKHGRHLKSIWTTAASWFSNTPDKQAARLPKTVAKRNLGKAVWRATLTANENCRESFRYRQISASSGAFFLSAFQFSAFQLYPNPLFPRNPHFPAPPVRPNGSFRSLPQKANS